MKIMNTTPRQARETLREILESRCILDFKNNSQANAFACGAYMIQQRINRGARYERNLAVMQYHANNPLAVVMQDEITREAIRCAIFCLNLYIAEYKGEERGKHGGE